MATDLQTVTARMRSMRGEFETVLHGADPDQFIRVVKTALLDSSALLGCSEQSIIKSALQCAQDGLLPDGREAAFVKRGGTCSYSPMVAGIIKRLYNSGQVVKISTDVVYSADDFEHGRKDGVDYLHHVKSLKGDRGDVIAAYAEITTSKGVVMSEIMTAADIAAVRAKGAANGPWRDFFGEMARKSVLRRLAKRLPISADDRRVIMTEAEYGEAREQSAPSLTLAEKLAAKMQVNEPQPMHDADGVVIDQPAPGNDTLFIDLMGAAQGGEAALDAALAELTDGQRAALTDSQMQQLRGEAMGNG